MAMVLADYKHYTIQCKDCKVDKTNSFNMADLTIKDSKEVRSIGNASFFYSEPFYYLELYLSNELFKCCFQLKDGKIIIEKPVNKIKFTLLESFFINDWETCKVPILIKDIIYGWDINWGYQSTTLFNNKDGKIKILQRNFIKQENKLYNIKSRFKDGFIFFQIEIHDEIPYTKTKGFSIIENSSIMGKYYIYYEAYELIQFYFNNDKLEIDEDIVGYYNDKYWINFKNRGIFEIPFTNNGFKLKFQDNKHAKFQSFNNCYLENLLEDFTMGKSPQNIAELLNIEKIIYTYNIFYGNYQLGQMFIKQNEIRFHPHAECIMINHNGTYMIMVSDDGYLIKGSFHNINGKLNVLTEDFLALYPELHFEDTIFKKLPLTVKVTSLKS